ncbi:Dbl homology domain-containing protein [Xylariaceae sp. FL0255]|nr:Dbl homology domain-containing protein [Xylariaceae sp. FL0255]
MALVVLRSDSPLSRPQGKALQVTKRNNDWVTSASPPPKLRSSWSDPDPDSDYKSLSRDDTKDIWKALDSIPTFRLSLETDEETSRSWPDVPKITIHQDDGSLSKENSALSPMRRPFQKWMKNLHRRAQRPRGHGSTMHYFPEYSQDEAPTSKMDSHRKSSSGSSFGFVAAVKSATVSLASASLRTRPKRHPNRSSIHTRTDLSSRGSFSAQRISEDSVFHEKASQIDPTVTERLLQRRRILEEIISTEESYIGDIRFLMNVYVTILASLPTLHCGLRSSINRNLTDIIELHEEILGELHRIVPNSEYTQPDHIVLKPTPNPNQRHHRWHSLDSVPEDKGRDSWLQGIPSVIAEPQIAAGVAQIFMRKMNRFFIYEEYGARYEMMIKDVASAHRMLPQWPKYQKGLEALAASLSASHSHLDQSKKSLTIGDLLVKPIQRICRYPLLFAELLKYTPVCDCPNSHIEIERVLIRLREATSEINRATDDPSMKVCLEQTWLLQDRLVFPNEGHEATSKTTVRSLGQVQLCGALHVCWQTKDGVSGQYMVSILYKNCLCLAIAGKTDQVYTIQACIGLDRIKVEEADNGRGLQCHTAPFSWKLVFECDHQLYEMIMTACSQKEETEWRTRLSLADSLNSLESPEPAFYSSIFLHIRSLGTVFGKPGTVARRLSIHRATTIGPKSPMCQIILKNTSTARDSPPGTLPLPINRSQSLLTTNRIPVLAPPRAERIRLEALLADVWSRKSLPFPGFTSRSRSENLVRNSASTMMRKLSVASLTNPFTKRASSSANSNRKPLDDEVQYPHVNKFVEALVGVNCDAPVAPKTETLNDSSLQRLPIIQDEIERVSSNGSSSQAADGGGSTCTVRHTEISRFEVRHDEDRDSRTLYLRTPSANSIPTKQHLTLSIKSTSPCSLESDKSSQAPEKMESQRDCLGAPRVSRWPRVSVMNRGLLALGGRSFFH